MVQVTNPRLTFLEWIVFIFAIIATLLFSFSAVKIGALRRSRTLTRQEDETFPSMGFLYTANIIFAIISGLIALLSLYFIFSKSTGSGASTGREIAPGVQEALQYRLRNPLYNPQAAVVQATS